MNHIEEVIAFLKARLDEDERVAQAVRVPHDWHQGPGDDPEWSDEEMVCMWPPEFHTPYEQDKHWRGLTVEGAELAAHIARHDPARALREVEATRTLLKSWEHLQRSIEGADDREKRARYALTRHGLDAFLYQSATVYADHPDYREEWRP